MLRLLDRVMLTSLTRSTVEIDIKAMPLFAFYVSCARKYVTLKYQILFAANRDLCKHMQ